GRGFEPPRAKSSQRPERCASTIPPSRQIVTYGAYRPRTGGSTRRSHAATWQGCGHYTQTAINLLLRSGCTFRFAVPSFNERVPFGERKPCMRLNALDARVNRKGCHHLLKFDSWHFTVKNLLELPIQRIPFVRILGLAGFF